MTELESLALLSSLNKHVVLRDSFLGAGYTYTDFAPKVKAAGFSLAEEELRQINTYIHAESMQGWSLSSICARMGI